jgi:hypothetical protein
LTRRFSIVFALVVLAGLLLAACAVQQEQPKEEAAEEAGVEEIAQPSPEEIQAEGCPEGQVANEAGTECYPEEEQQRAQEKIEQQSREQAQEWVSRYENGKIFPTQQNPPETLQLECQMRKAFAAGGQEHVDEIQEPVFERATRNAQARQKGETPEEGPDLSEEFANAGYTCPPPPPPAPSPEELDKKYEKPADNPKQREVQCGPQSNASPEFREKYC